MKNTIKLTACALALSAMAAFAGTDKTSEDVAVTALPAAVTKSVTDKWPDSTIANAKKETKDDMTCYKVRVKTGEDIYVAWVSEDGSITKSKEKDKNKK